MPEARKKLGLLLSVGPSQPAFEQCLALARAALEQSIAVYLYCIDEAVRGLDHHQLRELQHAGLTLYACAYGAQRRDLPINDLATFSGLGTLSDIMVGTDRFVSF